MDCPRCGGTIEVFQLGDTDSLVCQDCAYVGIPADHGAEISRSESWDEALARFREKYRTDRQQEGGESPPDLDRLLRTLDLPGSGDTLERRRDAVTTMYEFLRNQGRATRDELLEEIDPDALGYAHVDSFWSNAGRPGLHALPGILPPESGEQEWQFDLAELER